MSSSHRSWFLSRTRQLARQIDDYLDAIAEGAVVFQLGAQKYLSRDEDGFSAKMRQLVDLEHQGDRLKRRIQTEIYSEMLIPESRGDVLHLIWHLDELLDAVKHKLQILDITRPEIPAELHESFHELIEMVVRSVDATVQGARCYFRDVRAVRDHVQRAIFFESESDKIEERMLRQIYRSDWPLIEKRVLRETIEAISLIANLAEDGSDHLQIYAIKRTV